MDTINPTTYCIIGMSPGNSYFKDDEIKYLLKTTIERYGRVAIMIADIPAISTYMAFGYPENLARRTKALPQGNLLKNRTRRAIHELGYSNEQVRIIDWETEIESNEEYKKSYQHIRDLYNNDTQFMNDVDGTTKAVLVGSKREIADLDAATKIAVHYLLSEFAFLDWAPVFLNVDKVAYAYHKNWLVYENYIAGKYDGVSKTSTDFVLLENPYETYNPIWGLEDENQGEYADVLKRIESTKTLRVGFTNYIPAFMYDSDYNNFSGIFYEIIIEIAKKHGWRVIWTEETGYGVIVDGLNNNRFDLFGSAVWPTPERLAQADFSNSLYKSNVFAWMRPDFNKTNDDIKSDLTIRVAVKENDISDSIATADFSNNRQVKVPQLSDTMELLQFVADDRADFTFVEPYIAEQFNKESDSKLIQSSVESIRVYDNSFMIKKGEQKFIDLINRELAILEESGIIEKLIKKYTGSDDTYVR
jgi:tRNA-dependent cyclodipeptide synthase